MVENDLLGLCREITKKSCWDRGKDLTSARWWHGETSGWWHWNFKAVTFKVTKVTDNLQAQLSSVANMGRSHRYQETFAAPHIKAAVVRVTGECSVPFILTLAPPRLSIYHTCRCSPSILSTLSQVLRSPLTPNISSLSQLTVLHGWLLFPGLFEMMAASRHLCLRSPGQGGTCLFGKQPAAGLDVLMWVQCYLR